MNAESEAVKRAIDIVGAAAGLALAAPLLAVAACAIKLQDAGPVFFRQMRLGRGEQPFEILKLRTMTIDADRIRNDGIVEEGDPRITRVGHLLRRLSIDELPQLWNVLRGQMSMVGPRPLIEDEDRRIGGIMRGRLDLTPGITGLWQVLGRTSIPFDEMVKLDYLYVTNWSLWNDVRLILRTLPVVVTRRGAN